MLQESWESDAAVKAAQAPGPQVGLIGFFFISGR